MTHPTDYTRELAHDARLAFRHLRRAPGFAAVAILTLGIGIGATTAIFSAVNAVVLRPLPFRAPDELVRVYATSPSTSASDEVSPRTFAAWRRESRSFAAIAPIETRSFTFADGAQLPQQALGVRTTADYFPLLGIAPLIGRPFRAEEDRPGQSAVVVLSYRLWTTRFGADESVIGRTVRLNAVPHVIIGVMPPSFDVSARAVDL